MLKFFHLSNVARIEDLDALEFGVILEDAGLKHSLYFLKSNESPPTHQIQITTRKAGIPPNTHLLFATFTRQPGFRIDFYLAEILIKITLKVRYLVFDG